MEGQLERVQCHDLSKGYQRKAKSSPTIDEELADLPGRLPNKLKCND